MERKVRYRLEINYYSRDYDNKCCDISSPIYTKADGWKRYKQALNEKCIDDVTKTVRVHFWKYGPIDENGYFTQGETIARNY